MGYKLAGCDVIGCNEIDKRMNDVYVANHHPKYNYLQDIREFNKREDLLEELYNLDILDGSPPCTTFSMTGDREQSWGVKKKFREGQAEQTLDDLSFVFIDTVAKLKPKVMIMENVEGLILGDAWTYVQRIYKQLNAIGYKVKHWLLKGENMGVPQTRHRVFFVATRLDFDLDKIRHGKLSPVFFGSALNNFGVEPFLKSFLELTTPPLSRETAEGTVDPVADPFSAFVFKIQANMNKAHRDRIAFMRISSGMFDRNEEYFHVQGEKPIRLSRPQQMMAESRAGIETAYAGDIIGVFDPGIFSIGDTVCDKRHRVRFEGIPTFAPEHFAMIEQVDSMKRKQFAKGMEEIAEEGAIQIFFEPGAGMERVVVGVVGVLQFEVLEYRMKNEYGVDMRRSAMPHSEIRYVQSTPVPINRLRLTSDTKWVQDVRGRDLLIFTGEWSIRYALDNNEGLEFSEFAKR